MNPAAGTPTTRRERVRRTLDWTLPPPPVQREVLDHGPVEPVVGRSPILLVHGAGHSARDWQQRWLPQLAAAGWHGHALSLRGHGGSPATPRTTLRHYEHDVLQAITTLPSPPVLLGHGLGGLVVQRVLERYRSAPAGVLLAPVPPDHGLDLVATPGRHVPPAALVSAQVVLPRRVPGVRSPLLVIGGGDDRLIPPRAVARTARLHGTRPVLFRGLGHDLVHPPGADGVLGYVLDWLEATLGPGRAPGQARR